MTAFAETHLDFGPSRFGKITHPDGVARFPHFAGRNVDVLSALSQELRMCGHQMLIGPLATRDVLTVAADASLASAAGRMWEKRVGSAIVLEGEAAPAIITERDLLRAVAEGADMDTTRVSSYLTANAVAVTESWEVVDAARTMIDHGFRHLLVTNEGGDVVGVVSIRDMVAALVQERQRVLAG